MKKYLDNLRKIEKTILEMIDEIENQPAEGWENLEMDSVIVVRNSIEHPWKYAHFCKVTKDIDDYVVWAYRDGKSSKTSSDNYIEKVKFAKVV